MAVLPRATVQSSCDSNNNMNATRVISFPRAGHVDSKSDTEKQARVETRNSEEKGLRKGT